MVKDTLKDDGPCPMKTEQSENPLTVHLDDHVKKELYTA